MKHICMIMLVLAALSAPQLQAQTATDLNAGFRLAKDPSTDIFTLSWWGTTGRTYFVQTSTDLMHWSYLPLVESGAETVDAIQFTNTEVRQFWRLRYTDAPTDGDAELADFDGDWVPNMEELEQGLDPFNADTDGDGFYDGVGPQNGGNVSVVEAEIEDPAKTEQPVFLIEEYKSVGNDWSKDSSTSNGTTTTVSHGYLSWSDSTGTFGNEDYSTFEPRWDSKLAELGYPSSNASPPTWTVVGNHSVGASFLYTTENRADKWSSGRASVFYKRAALACSTAPQPWSVVRHYFAYEESRPVEGGSITYSKVRMQTLTIPQGTKVVFGGNRVLLEPAVEEGKTNLAHLGLVDASPVISPLVYDKTDLENWMMIPKGNNAGQLVSLRHQQSDLAEVAFQVKGGAVNPSLSTNSTHPYYTHFTSNAEGDQGGLHIALKNAEGGYEAAAKPLFKFTVKPRRDLVVNIQPIALISTRSGPTHGITYYPLNVPSKEEAENYLNSVFAVQANVYTTVNVLPVVPVAYDIGLGFGSNYGVRDNMLNVFNGKFSRISEDSWEELTIQAHAQPAPSVGITVYWVATADAITAFSWPDAASEMGGDPAQLRRQSIRGIASKAMGRRSPKVVWICAQEDPPAERPMLWTLAHELAHALGNLGHSIDSYSFSSPPDPSFSYWSDNHLRLMTGMAGPKRESAPTRLTKYEWDQIHTFDGYEE